MRFHHHSGTDIEIVVGNIAFEECDAIVNAANASLLAGSGVCGAIFAGAGEKLQPECNEIINSLGRNLYTSEAVLTSGCSLKAKYIIHAVAPKCMMRWDEKIDNTMRSLYKNIYALAEKEGCTSIAIPAMGTGVYRCDPIKSTDIAIDELLVFLENHKNHVIKKIRFVVHGKEMANVYIDTLRLAIQHDGVQS